MMYLPHANLVAGVAANPSKTSRAMIKVFRIILILLGLVAVAAWGLGYIWISAMACGFSGPNNSNCGVPLPWELGSEDMWLMVILPAALVTAIFGLAWWLGCKRQSNDI